MSFECYMLSLLHFHIYAFSNCLWLFNFCENNWKECQRLASVISQVSQFHKTVCLSLDILCCVHQCCCSVK